MLTDCVKVSSPFVFKGKSVDTRVHFAIPSWDDREAFSQYLRGKGFRPHSVLLDTMLDAVELVKANKDMKELLNKRNIPCLNIPFFYDSNKEVFNEALAALVLLSHSPDNMWHKVEFLKQVVGQSVTSERWRHVRNVLLYAVGGGSVSLASLLATLHSHGVLQWFLMTFTVGMAYFTTSALKRERERYTFSLLMRQREHTYQRLEFYEWLVEELGDVLTVEQLKRLRTGATSLCASLSVDVRPSPILNPHIIFM